MGETDSTNGGFGFSYELAWAIHSTRRPNIWAEITKLGGMDFIRWSLLITGKKRCKYWESSRAQWIRVVNWRSMSSFSWEYVARKPNPWSSSLSYWVTAICRSGEVTPSLYSYKKPQLLKISWVLLCSSESRELNTLEETLVPGVITEPAYSTLSRILNCIYLNPVLYGFNTKTNVNYVTFLAPPNPETLIWGISGIMTGTWWIWICCSIVAIFTLAIWNDIVLFYCHFYVSKIIYPQLFIHAK